MQYGAIARPSKLRPGVGLPSRRNVAVAYDTVGGNGGIVLLQRTGDGGEHGILAVAVGLVIAAFELDADGKVIAALTSGKTGWACMPGAAVERNILHHLAVATNQHMRGDTQRGDALEIGVGRRFQLVGEQRVDPRTAEFSRRQADAVDHQQLDGAARGPLILIGGKQAQYRYQPACCNCECHPLSPVTDALPWSRPRRQGAVKHETLPTASLIR